MEFLLLFGVALAVFGVLLDNKNTRDELRAYKVQHNGNMGSFFNRLKVLEDDVNLMPNTMENLNKAMGESLGNLAFRVGQEDKKLEEMVEEVSDSASQTVDNVNEAIMGMQKANAAIINSLSSRVAYLEMKGRKKAKKKAKKANDKK